MRPNCIGVISMSGSAGQRDASGRGKMAAHRRKARESTATEDNRAVLATKGNAVTEDDIWPNFSRLSGDVVKVAAFVGYFEIDRGMKEAGVHAENCRGDARGAAGALGMANH